jgi:hypothetical protein
MLNVKALRPLKHYIPEVRTKVMDDKSRRSYLRVQR